MGTGRSGGRAIGTREPAALLTARTCDGLADIVPLGFRIDQLALRNADASFGLVIRIAFRLNRTNTFRV